MSIHIEVQKVSNSSDKKSKDGTKVINPHEKSVVKEKEIKILDEVININEIKSFRPWNKTHEEELSVDSDMTIIYLYGNREKDTPPQMLIAESFSSFKERLNTIKLTRNVRAEG